MHPGASTGPSAPPTRPHSQPVGTRRGSCSTRDADRFRDRRIPCGPVEERDTRRSRSWCRAPPRRRARGSPSRSRARSPRPPARPACAQRRKLTSSPVSAGFPLARRALAASVAVEQARGERDPVGVDRGERRHHRAHADAGRRCRRGPAPRARRAGRRATRPSAIVLEAVGRRNPDLVRDPRLRDDVAVLVGGERLDRRRADVDADRDRAPHVGPTAGAERGEHLVVQEPVRRPRRSRRRRCGRPRGR